MKNLIIVFIVIVTGYVFVTMKLENNKINAMYTEKEEQEKALQEKYADLEEEKILLELKVEEQQDTIDELTEMYQDAIN